MTSLKLLSRKGKAYNRKSRVSIQGGMNGHNRGQASAWYPVEQDGFEVSVVVSEIVLIYNECSTAHTADRKKVYND